MKTERQFYSLVNQLVLLLVAALFLECSFTAKAEEDKIPVLRTKTGVYTNVTVTTKTRDWIFILHSAGMVNVKVSDLDHGTLRALGYTVNQEEADNIDLAAKPAPEQQPAAEEEKPVVVPNYPKAHLTWVAFKDFLKRVHKNGPAELSRFAHAHPILLCAVSGSFGLFFVFFGYCSRLICRKVHISPGLMVWVPILQIFSLLRAAGMSELWFFGFFIPGLNILTITAWSIRIVQERGKSPWVALLLVLPITNVFAFVYLALSDEAPVELNVKTLGGGPKPDKKAGDTTPRLVAFGI